MWDWWFCGLGFGLEVSVVVVGFGFGVGILGDLGGWLRWGLGFPVWSG